jgi:hypothetical protein
MLATGWIDGRRENYHIQRGTVMERYRSHLILVKAHQEPDTDVWRASIHVQFNEDALTFRDVQMPGPASHFPTKTIAEKHSLKEAKQWVDRRLRKVKNPYTVDSRCTRPFSLKDFGSTGDCNPSLDLHA